ncbi:MAG: hemerythrin family protein [Gammaproteobacteria bacterium]|nr:hemerythrin family protein [Gammaproteobacteria bacterium]
MEKIVWTDDFSVGSIEFDNQHKKLLKIINKLFDDNVYSTYSEHISRVFTELIDYIDRHLKHEEMFLHLNGYPDVENHINRHHEMIEEFAEQMKKVVGYKDNLPEELQNFFSQWFEEHVRHDITAFRELIEEKR